MNAEPLDLAEGQTLDLAELAEAMGAAGFIGIEHSGMTIMGTLPENKGRFVWWPRTREHPVLAFALRDAVRRIAPCAKVFPVVNHPNNLMIHMCDGRGRTILPIFCLAQKTETECWVLALVALFRAGMLKGADS